MRGRWRARSVVLLAAALLTACGGSSATPRFASPTGALPAGSFLAVYAHGAGDTGGGHGSSLSLFDLRTGVRLRDLLQLPERSGVALSGQARDAAGDVYLGLSSRLPAQDPADGSTPTSGGCADAVWRIDAGTGRHTRVFVVDRGRLLRAPVPSRDGRSVAYLSSSCPRSDRGGSGGGRNMTAPGDTVTVIRDLPTGRERQLPGAAVPSWSVDGSRLVAPHDSGSFIVTNVAASTEEHPVVLPVPGGGCLDAVAIDRAGIALAVGCTASAETARLVQLDDTGSTVLWSAPTQLCPNGMTLVADATGDRLLITATATDATTGNCSGPAAPVDVVQAWTGQQTHDIARYTNPQQFLSNATW